MYIYIYMILYVLICSYNHTHIPACRHTHTKPTQECTCYAPTRGMIRSMATNTKLEFTLLHGALVA